MFLELLDGVIKLATNAFHELAISTSTSPWQGALGFFFVLLESGAFDTLWEAAEALVTGIIARNIKITRNDAGQTQFASIGSCRDFRRVLQPSAPSAEDLYKRRRGPSHSLAFRSSYSSIKRHRGLISSG